jgi:hypothetical protein
VLTAAAASITSVSPKIAVAGSSDLTIMVTGANFVASFPISTWIRWSANGRTTDIATRVITSTTLTAVIPAALLRDGTTAKIGVVRGDAQKAADGLNSPTEDSITFLVIPYNGTWTGAITDWVGTADAKLVLNTEKSTLEYSYRGTSADRSWYDVTEGHGFVSIDAVDDGNALSLTFTGGTTHGRCWAGHFQGTFAVNEAGMNSFTGTYSVWGTTDECFNPPRRGTFSFERDPGGG